MWSRWARTSKRSIILLVSPCQGILECRRWQQKSKALDFCSEQGTCSQAVKPGARSSVPLISTHGVAVTLIQLADPELQPLNQQSNSRTWGRPSHVTTWGRAGPTSRGHPQSPNHLKPHSHPKPPLCFSRASGQPCVPLSPAQGSVPTLLSTRQPSQPASPGGFMSQALLQTHMPSPLEPTAVSHVNRALSGQGDG